MAPIQLKIPKTSQKQDEGSRWTIYHIEVCFPNNLRRIVFRRFSEFVSLDEKIRPFDDMGALPNLPSKSWFQSTVTNEGFRESRRVALQGYIKALNKSPWIEMGEVKSFLNLENNFDNASKESSLGPVEWMQLFHECKRDLHASRVDLLSKKNSTIYGQKRSVYNAKRSIDLLFSSLHRLEQMNAVGSGEVFRRRDMLDKLSSELSSYQKLMRNLTRPASPPASSAEVTASSSPGSPFKPISSSSDQQNSLRSTPSSNRVLGKNHSQETSTTRKLDNVGLYQLQNQVLTSQDTQAEALLPSIQRQKEISMAINNEVIEQNAMLDDVAHGTDKNRKKMRKTKDRLRQLG
ncbi:vacuolar SNARE Vam7 [Schizosaccharomyces octosporus yFS286]|uniref:Vacuolar SNARE Vam7 n=1 Tax=Schizosaccharomyces octosporus (strain yFS286) TaxID=483514 RepID=S9PV10_SCHOY|nr:vacuolar SNARE Vam7 [Schizosaccharomyces octosporus yFS286]EPX71832.1 vacuolar SNARE Vam7 [Schizosaccharomyces octosporus yFS286]